MSAGQIEKSSYRMLGATGIMVSPFTLGGWAFGGAPAYPYQDDNESIRVIRTAIELGINTIDTAEAYGSGHSEEIIGRAIRESGAEVIVTGKVATFGEAKEGIPGGRIQAAQVRISVEGSLKRLRRECMDVCLLHWPSRDVEMEDVLEEMAKLKEEGKLRAIGVSNFMRSELESTCALRMIDVCQQPYSLIWRCLEDSVFPFCRDKRIALTAYSPLANGLLTDAFSRNGRRPLNEAQSWLVLFREPFFSAATQILDTVERLARGYACTISQMALVWALANPSIQSIILGIEKTSELSENLRALSVTLSPSDLSVLNEAGNMLKSLTSELSMRSMTDWWPDKRLYF